MAAAVHFAAQSRPLDQHVFHAKSEAFFVDVPPLRQLQLRFFDPERSFQDRLHAQRTFHASAACAPDPPLHAHGSIPSKRFIWAGLSGPSIGRQIQGPEAMGSRESAPRMRCCQWMNSIAEQAQSA